MDKSRISISQRQNKLEIKIEKREHSVWETIEKTDNPKKISEYIKEIEKEITSFKLEDNNLYGNINNNTTLTIYNYPIIKDNELLKPIINRRKKLYNKMIKRKKLLLKSLLLVIGGTSAFGMYSYHKHQEKIKNEQEDDKDKLKIELEKQEKNNKIQKEIAEVIKKMEEKEKSFYNSLPTIGINKNDARIFYVQEEYKNSIQKYAAISGIDEAIIECIIAQESGIGVNLEKNSGGAIGPAQIQYNYYVNQPRTIYNVVTGEKETFIATPQMLSSIDGNIKVCASVIQEQLIRYKGNIFLAIQAYNFGQGAMNKVLKQTADQTPYEVEDLINDPYNLVWIKQVEEYSNQKERETGNRYGDSSYLQKILSFYYKDELIIKYKTIDKQNSKLTQDDNEIIYLNQKEKSPI